jgi:hypothetical protein
MKTIVYSASEMYYYVKEFACPWCNWISTMKFKTKKEANVGWVSNMMAYGKSVKYVSYYRSVLPFTFWKIKTGKSVQVEDDDELVRDYVPCSKHRPRFLNRKDQKIKVILV